MVFESNLQQHSQVRRRSSARSQQLRAERRVTPTTAPVTTANNFVLWEQPQGRQRVRSMSMQHNQGDSAITGVGLSSFNRTNSTISENALFWLNRDSEPSGLNGRRDAHSPNGSAIGSLVSTDASPTSSGTSSRRPSRGDLYGQTAPGSNVATRLAHQQNDLSPVPEARPAALGETRSEAPETAQNDSWQPAASTSTSGYSVQRLPTLAQRMTEPEAIWLTELLTNLMGLISTVVESGPIDYAAGHAVGPLAIANAVQLFHSNWANAGETRVSEVSVLASLGSQYAAMMSSWTGWWASESADFHSRAGAIAGIASEIADVRDAWNDRNENPARSIALVIRILSIWAASISTFLSLYEAENEGSMAPTYSLSASVLPVVGTFAGMTAEALTRTSVRNQLRALIDRIRALIRRLMDRLEGRDRSSTTLDLLPV
jgi:hypothetical protein